MAYIILRVVNCSHGDSVNVYFPGTFELGDEEKEEIYEVINISKVKAHTPNLKVSRVSL